MNIRQFVLGLTTACALAGASHAATLVVPNTPETSGVNTALRNAPRTYMALYTNINFATLSTPMLITGIQFRISELGNTAVPPTWPSQPISFTNFDIKLSQASAALLSDGQFLNPVTNFASQQAGTVTTVRWGGLTIAPGSYTNTGATNAFGTAITFTTPYLYSPGQSLLLYLTHTGYLPGSEVQPFFATANFQSGATDAIASTAGYQAASSSGFSTPYIVQFTLAPVPEPGTALSLSLGLLALLASVRRRQAL